MLWQKYGHMVSQTFYFFFNFHILLFDNNLNNLLLYWNNIDLAINFHPVWNNSKNKWNRPISHVLQLVAAMAYLVKALEWKIYLIEMTLLTPRYNCSNPQCISVLTQVADVGSLSEWGTVNLIKVSCYNTLCSRGHSVS